MNKLRQIEVEPLSEQRWSRIERALLSRLALEAGDGPKARPQARSRTRGLVWLVAAALGGALVGAILLMAGLPERAAVEQPSRVATGATPTHLALPGLSLDVEPQSAVVVGAETPQGLLIVVDRGSIVCQVAPRPSGAPLVVQAGAARIRVLGTQFKVTRLGESARVSVAEGVVEIGSGGRLWKVRAGEVWPAEVPPPASVDTPRLPPVAKPMPESTGPMTPPAERSVPVPVRRKSPSEAAAPDGPVTEAPVETTSSTRQATFEKATALERSEPGRASQLYALLESGNDSWAQNALYAHGRLEAARGNRGEARRLLARYLERFPSGGNAEDARAVLSRIR